MDHGEGTPIPKRDLGIAATPERPHGLEVGRMAKYRSAFEHLIPQVEAKIDDPERYKADYALNVTGESEGTRYSVRLPHLRRGKHAFVGIVDLNGADGETASAVIRNNVDDARAYSELAATHPIVRTLVPDLYGISGDWVIMERLQGLELEELETRLRDDPDFRRRYARSAFNVTASAAEAGLQLNDVAFINGHNVMVSPDDAQIRLVEQRTLAPTIFDPNETITNQLFSELTHVSDREEEWRTDYAMQLLQAAIERVGAENLYMKGRAIKPTNPNYKDAYFLERWGKLSDVDYQKILDNPVAREKMTVSWFGRGYTEAFTEDTIDAVKSGDREKFKAAIAGRKYKRDITDKEDPRYGVVVLPDDFS